MSIAQLAHRKSAYETWFGTLAGLGDLLKRDAAAAPGRWHARVLENGIQISFRLRHIGALQCCISREDAPLTRRQRAQWEREVGGFVVQLGIADWSRTHFSEIKRIAFAIYSDRRRVA
jgi:hypothetical protein